MRSNWRTCMFWLSCIT